MVVIMAAKLIVKKEFQDSEVHFEINGMPRKLVLKDATQDELKEAHKAGVDVFEKAAEK